MKTIQIADQPGPGLRRLARITADGIRYRLFRSAVTLAVVATAIAFLMNMVTEGLIRRSVGIHARQELKDRRHTHTQQTVSAPVEDYFQTPEIKQLIAGYLNVLPSEVTAAMTWQLLESSSAAEWLQNTTHERGLPKPPQSTEQLVSLAHEFATETRLATADRLTQEVGSGFLGLGTRMVWLLLVSLLVCTIGITNAMLMSVTERFREIATMKCLGALDGVIMGIFVLESCILGLTGGAIGAVAGITIGTCRSLTTLGWMFFPQLPVLDLVGAAGLAMVVGFLLSAIAAVYPAWQAARLAPMEAMRIQ